MSNQTNRLINLYGKWEEQGCVNTRNLQGIRNYLKWKFGAKCSICGGSNWQGWEMPLLVDHKDGKASNGNLDNFRLVCPNCDAQLPTYKGRNKGKSTRRR